MDFNLTDEQQMLREGTERYLLESYTFDDRKLSLREPRGCRDEAWQAFAEMGWLALVVPEDAGGLGTGLLEATLVAEAMGRRAVIEPYASSAVLASRPCTASNSSRAPCMAITPAAPKAAATDSHRVLNKWAQW